MRRRKRNKPTKDASSDGDFLQVVAAEDAHLAAGGSAAYGEATCIVESIGASIFYGRTTELVRSAAPKLHLDEIVGRLVRWLLLIVSVVLAIFATVSVAGGAPIREICRSGSSC